MSTEKTKHLKEFYGKFPINYNVKKKTKKKMKKRKKIINLKFILVQIFIPMFLYKAELLSSFIFFLLIKIT